MDQYGTLKIYTIVFTGMVKGSAQHKRLCVTTHHNLKLSNAEKEVAEHKAAAEQNEKGRYCYIFTPEDFSL